MDLNSYIACIPDFPTKGILFRDITPLMADGEAYHYACEKLAEYARSVNADLVVGPESRGFLFGCPIANMLNIGFVPIRKPGKLPRQTISFKYELEYGENELYIHKDAIKPGQRVLIVDDLVATGGTADAATKLIEELGGEVAGCAFLIELEGLGGREKLSNYDVFTLLKY
ncbi:MAG: adenine phosphoribosyltransferase [Erysipelotrichaceae bacterium]|nr:adenine phosphoribosyltransferase [Erysipelotrichaceae bacterium]